MKAYHFFLLLAFLLVSSEKGKGSQAIGPYCCCNYWGAGCIDGDGKCCTTNPKYDAPSTELICMRNNVQRSGDITACQQKPPPPGR